MERVGGSLMAVGLILAAISGILYFLNLPIFNPVAVAWVIFGALIGTGLAGGGMALRSIWDSPNT